MHHYGIDSPFHRHGRRFMRGHRHGMGGGRHFGFAPFGGGFGEAMGGGRGFRAGRKLGAGGLQLLIIALLKEKPRYGYEIIKGLEERSGGFYAPSPGMVYPALTYLEELGHATVKDDGAKRLYRITGEGEAELEKNREAADAMLERLTRIGQKMERVREVFSGGEAGEEEESAPELKAARRALKMALREKHAAPRAEQKRLAEILDRATREIRGS